MTIVRQFQWTRYSTVSRRDMHHLRFPAQQSEDAPRSVPLDRG